MRKKLIDAAKKLFALKGLHGVSVSEIAERAGVSAAMINHHFGGKTGLYRDCVAGFGAARLAALERLISPPKSKQEFEIRLGLIVREMVELHMEDLDSVTILLRDANAAEHWGADVEQSVYQFSMMLGRFFAMAQDQDLLRPSINPITPAATIYLSLAGLLQVDAHRERVSGLSLRDPDYRETVIAQLLDLVLHGILAHEPQDVV